MGDDLMVNNWHVSIIAAKLPRVMPQLVLPLKEEFDSAIALNINVPEGDGWLPGTSRRAY